MQRRILEEDIVDQLRRNLGVEADAALGDERQIALLPDDDQCAGLRIGHFAAGHHQRLQIGFGYLRAVVENARNEIEPLLAHADAGTGVFRAGKPRSARWRRR